ncbi:ceramidase domain-containing protein [Pseudonocardia acaciae]|uniref:ceramidase domain-containing protein n=1 Tax=Pseudonocardia acaciae TaxID=551276 RepID=UPI00048FF1FB|nr:ceramidase domain-containing protein [Pseudonocardia acaciae]
MDGYCERHDPSFWAEPVNALTNAAFLVAAVLLARGLRRGRDRAPRDVSALVVILAVIGVGSFLFHTLATGWAALADTLPIALFMLGFVVVFVHRFAGVRPARAWLAAPAFVLFAAVVAGATAAMRLPGLYAPALLALALITAWLAVRRDPGRRPFAVATALFAASLTLRQLDGPLCPHWPLGTHFGWHVLNATVLYLLVRTTLRRSTSP